MVAVNPNTYYDAGAACYALSRDFQAAFNPLQTALYETGGMAGGYAAARGWADAYDKRASDLVSAAIEFARATHNLGDIFVASGHNWHVSNHRANPDPNKGAEPAAPSKVPSELPYGSGVVVGVASSKKNSDGVETDISGLFEQVAARTENREIPDGSTDRLERAATAWRAFADHDGVDRTGASLRSLSQVIGFEKAPDIANLVDHLGTLARRADQISSAADDLANTTGAHHRALNQMRAQIEVDVKILIAGVAIIIAATAVSIRAGAGAGAGGRTVRVADDVIESTATAIAGCIGNFLAALRGLVFSTEAVGTTALAGILGLTVATVAGDSAETPAPPPPGTPKEITGRTKHGEEQAQSRDGHGVSDSAIDDAVRNPTTTPEAQANGTYKFIGKDAIVILNGAGQVVTTWATNHNGWRHP